MYFSSILIQKHQYNTASDSLIKTVEITFSEQMHLTITTIISERAKNNVEHVHSEGQFRAVILCEMLWVGAAPRVLSQNIILQQSVVSAQSWSSSLLQESQGIVDAARHGMNAVTLAWKLLYQRTRRRIDFGGLGGLVFAAEGSRTSLLQRQCCCSMQCLSPLQVRSRGLGVAASFS